MVVLNYIFGSLMGIARFDMGVGIRLTNVDVGISYGIYLGQGEMRSVTERESKM
jgi:hypothetical protein